MRRILRTWLALGLLAPLRTADASFHSIKIVEVFPGTPAAPSAQYVVVQMFDDNQRFVDGRSVTVGDAAGATIGTFTFAADVAVGTVQSTILIATPEAVTFFNVAADLAMTAAMPLAGGHVCFAGSVDCVAWGNYTGSAPGVGTAFNATGGLIGGKAVVRDLKGNGTLEGSDDSGDNATDFAFGTPAPRNNAGANGAIPVSTCGNSTLEGIEGCDDGDLDPGDGCDAMCMVEGGPTLTTTTTTTLAGGSTTTTLAACAIDGIDGVRCLLDASPPPVCADARLPRSLRRAIGAAERLLTKAASTPERLPRLATKARAKLVRALALLGRAKLRAKLPAGCADALDALLMDAEARTATLAGS